jgi:MFS transporter, DHA2 family, multidrug resistance protein
LLAFSFFMNGFMSYLTEHSYIMTTLYIRGVAMGMMFSPLNAIAFRDIPREKMAQASGITNIIRQVGGSFGVAILTTGLTTRFLYHAQMFGRQMDPTSPEFQAVTGHLKQFVASTQGTIGAMAAQQGQYVLLTHLNKQAFIEAVNDDFMVAATLTLVSIFPVVFLKLRKKKTASPAQPVSQRGD